MYKVFLSVFLLVNTSVFSQNFKGKIIDALTGKPLSGVIIEFDNKTTQSDNEGLFEFSGENISVIYLTISGYEKKSLEINRNNTDDFIIEMEPDLIDSDLESGIISLSDLDLSDDNNSSDFSSGLLSSYNDVFQSIAAYQFGIARFRQRGYDSRNNKVLMNGVEMNKIYDGRPQWSNWGGLNDVLRNREYSNGLEVANSSFVGINGSTNFILRSSQYQKGFKISYSQTNTSYTNRVIATYTSNIRNWYYTISASRRWAEEGHFNGTFYDANSFFLSLENKINDNHSINLVGIYASNRRGKSSASTDEVYNLQTPNYNSYWGWQDGKRRNSRVKRLSEPIFLLTHYWKINDKLNLETSILNQFGLIGNSRINYSNGPNPDPTYYRKLPSYYLRNFNDRPELSEYSLQKFTSLSNYNQLDWNFMYSSNMIKDSNNKSIYMIYEDRVDDNIIQFNSVLDYEINENLELKVGLNAKRLISKSFAYTLDMLGGDYYVDVDSYRQGNEAQNDLNNPNRIIYKNEKFKYNFNVFSENVNLFSMVRYNLNKFNFVLSPKITYQTIQREGEYKNGVYPENSFGKGIKKEFIDGSGKIGIEYKLTGRHIFNLNGAYISRAPTIRNSFSNSRENHNFVEGLGSEKIYSIESSYNMNINPIKLKLSGYYTQFRDMNEISFFFAQGLSGLEESSDFVSEIMSGSNRDHYGLELGIESQLTSTLKMTSGVAFGEYIYTNNPNLYLTSDDISGVADYGTTYIKNYKVPGTPQRGYSIGLEHRDPKYWWISANANYLTNNYIDISPILRTNNFYLNPDDPDGFPFPEANELEARSLLKQEKFSDILLVNLFGGKSWKIDDYFIGVIVSANNILDRRYKSGGYEQSRNANYRLLKQDVDSGSRIFGPRYWYGYGRTYYINIYFRF